MSNEEIDHESKYEEAMHVIEELLLKHFNMKNWIELSNKVILEEMLKGYDRNDPIVRGFVRVSSFHISKKMKEGNWSGIK